LSGCIGQKAKQRAAEIKAAYATHVASLKAAQSSAFKGRTAQTEAMMTAAVADNAIAA
jgi:hypothetical protein